jgi:exosortase A-associated hydrolase 1
VILVGGPQYRAGSHRQFVLLARRLATEGFATLRFDYRGMGDSTGAAVSFEDTAPDIAAAIDALKAACPAVQRVVLWGLCDAASAALIYWNATRDARIAAMVLLNPWVRSEATLAKTQIKHYYGRRLFEREFLVKLLRGGVDIAGAVRGLVRNARASITHRAGNGATQHASFQDRMADAIGAFGGAILIVLSGRDLTAKEFREYTQADSRWNGLFGRPNIVRRELCEADHTFSSAQWRGEVEALTLACLADVGEERR